MANHNTGDRVPENPEKEPVKQEKSDQDIAKSVGPNQLKKIQEEGEEKKERESEEDPDKSEELGKAASDEDSDKSEGSSN